MSYDSEYSGDSSIDEVEVEDVVSHTSIADPCSGSDDEAADPCVDDLLADAEWTVKYEEEMQENEELEKKLKDRLEGCVVIDEW